MLADDAPTLRLDREDAVHTTTRTPGLLTLLFELSLAVALPPAAILAPPRAVRPAVRSDPYAILSARELAAALDRPVTEVGRGRVALGEVDARLGGLVVRLDVFRVTDRSVMLVSLSVVRADPAAGSDGRATPADLWALAHAALARHAVPGKPLAGLGEDAFLAIHGGRTAQVAWLAGERVATASVTCLAGENDWAVEAACRIAVVAEDHLALEDGLDPWQFLRTARLAGGREMSNADVQSWT